MDITDDEQNQYKLVVCLAKERGQATEHHSANYRKLHESIREIPKSHSLPAPRPMTVQNKFNVRLKLADNPVKIKKKPINQTAAIIRNERIKEMNPSMEVSQTVEGKHSQTFVQSEQPPAIHPANINYATIQRNDLKLCKRLYKLQSEFEKIISTSNQHGSKQVIVESEEHWEKKLLAPLFRDDEFKHPFANIASTSLFSAKKHKSHPIVVKNQHARDVFFEKIRKHIIDNSKVHYRSLRRCYPRIKQN